MTGDTWGPHHGCPGAEVRSLRRTAEAGQWVLFPCAAQGQVSWDSLHKRQPGEAGGPLTSLPSAGRREDGEEGIAFETEEERQQWEDDQRVGVWGAQRPVNAGLRAAAAGPRAPGELCRGGRPGTAAGLAVGPLAAGGLPPAARRGAAGGPAQPEQAAELSAAPPFPAS